MRGHAILGLAAAAAFVGLQASRATAAPLEAYGKLPSVGTIKVSPDGARLAATIANNEQQSLVVKEIADNSTRSYSLGTQKLRAIDWFGPDHLIVTTSVTSTIAGVTSPRSEFMVGSDLDVRAGRVTPLLQETPGGPQTGTRIANADTGKVNGTLNILVGSPEVRSVGGSPTLFLTGISFPGSRGVVTVFRHNPRSDTPSLVAVGGEATSGYVLDEAGAPIAEETYGRGSGRWALRLHSSGGWKEAYVVQALNDPPQLLGLGRDGRSVVVADLADGKTRVREISIDGVWSEPLEVASIDGPIFDPDTHRLIGVYALVGDEHRYSFFNEADQRAWNSVSAAFKGDGVRLVSWSADRKKIVVLVDSSTEGEAFALVDLNTRRADWIGARYPELSGKDIAKVERLRFKAADGLELTGYLTLPAGSVAKDLPLVVLPHGGPAVRDTPSFDWWAQAIASRGYAVLQVNYRGSDGFGQAFLQAGYGEWGRKMQTDLSDGVRHLAGRGLVDPKRVCIVGASYGGYAALAGVTLDPGVYRCAVSVAGLSDLRRFQGWLRNTKGRDSERYFGRFIGAEDRRDPALLEVSPVAHVDKVAAPILLIHGRDDTVVPLVQSQVMADALKKAGKPVDLLVLRGEDHWLSRADTRLAMLKATVEFLEKNNPLH